MLLVSLTMWGAPYVVVIDAGHGGHDPGAVGVNTNEKSINLGVALRLGSALSQAMGKDVKVIYTRADDTFVPLITRADIANRASADLFISIHANSISDLHRRTTINGASVYVRGFASSKQASEVAKRENAVVTLEDKTKINTTSEESLLNDLVWNKHLDESIRLADILLERLVADAGRKRGAVEQNDLAVLKRTKMPAVLVELDFICNPAMEKFMASEVGQQKLASALCNGVMKFRNPSARTIKAKTASHPPISGKVETKVETKDNLKTEPKASAATAPSEDYRIQFLTSPRVLPEKSPKLKGLSPTSYYLDGSTYKYTFGSYTSQQEAMKKLPDIRTLFPDAFVVYFKEGKRIK